MAPLEDLITDLASDAISNTLESNKTPKIIKGCFFGYFVLACLLFGCIMLFNKELFIVGRIIGLLVSGGFAYLGIRYIVNLFRKKPEESKPGDEKSDSAPDSKE